VIDTSPQTGYLTAIPEMFGLSPIRLTSRPHKERQRLARTHGRGRERQANWTAHLETGTIGTEGSNSSRFQSAFPLWRNAQEEASSQGKFPGNLVWNSRERSNNNGHCDGVFLGQAPCQKDRLGLLL
jgi:hypothetical protein